MRTFWYRKSVESLRAASEGDRARAQLMRRLGWFDLICIGIGVIVGGGIFIVTGTAAAQYAGPAITLSFLLAAAGCAFVGLCYAELASMLPVSGSGYAYAYVTLGEGIAWVVGWNILLEYLCAASYIAAGWSGYAVSFAHKVGLALPAGLVTPPIELVDGRLSYHGGFNIPSVLVSVGVLLVARRGITLSARVNAVLVSLKVGILLLFLAAAGRYVSIANWIPFVPPNSGVFGHYGWSGVLRGAAVVFVAFLGFDALSTLAQETRNPQRDMPIGVIGSLAVCTVLYISVALVLTGITPYWTLNVPSPLSTALQAVGGALDWLAPLVEIVAMSGLASVLLIVLAAQARICLAMGQDGLLPAPFARIHSRHHTPSLATVVGGLLVAVLSSLFPVAALSQLVSLGTLTVFIVVCGGVLVLRRTRPDIPRAFKVPGRWLMPAAGIAICLYLLIGIPEQAWALFGAWSLGGLLIYSLFGRRRAALLRG